MSKQPKRVLDTAAKQALLLRHASGETLGRLARETGILRKSLYEWRDAYRCFGIAGLNRKRGPKLGGKAGGEKPPARPVSGAPPGPDGAADTGRGAIGSRCRLHCPTNWRRPAPKSPNWSA